MRTSLACSGSLATLVTARTAAAAVTLAGLLIGCESAEERCNAARVSAHDAWSRYTALVQGDAAAASAAYTAAEPGARIVRDEACRAAWSQYMSDLMEAHAAATDEAARLQFLVAGAGVMSAMNADTPCADTRSETARGTEGRFVAAGGVGAGLVARRTTAMTSATATYEALAVPLLLARRDETAARASSAARAQSLATGPAIAARDAYLAVPEDPRPERAAAWAASEASWEACQAVDP